MINGHLSHQTSPYLLLPAFPLESLFCVLDEVSTNTLPWSGDQQPCRYDQSKQAFDCSIKIELVNFRSIDSSIRLLNSRDYSPAASKVFLRKYSDGNSHRSMSSEKGATAQSDELALILPNFEGGACEENGSHSANLGHFFGILVVSSSMKEQIIIQKNGKASKMVLYDQKAKQAKRGKRVTRCNSCMESYRWTISEPLSLSPPDKHTITNLIASHTSPSKYAYSTISGADLRYPV